MPTGAPPHPRRTPSSCREPPGGITAAHSRYTGIVYVRPQHQEAPLTFGVSGMLWKDSLITYDRQTRSLWRHVTGKALKGPLQSVQPLVNDRVGTEPVVVVFAKEAATATAFSRRVGGKTLEFRQLRVVGGDLLMTDAETGSTWRALEGVAVAGRLKGQRLGQVPGTMAF